MQGKYQQRAQHSDDDDDEGGTRGSTMGQRRSSDRGSGDDAAHTALSIGPPSVLALVAMRDVTMRFHNKECEVSALIDSALGADPSNFKKVRTFSLIALLPTKLSLNSLITLPSPLFYPPLLSSPSLFIISFCRPSHLYFLFLSTSSLPPFFLFYFYFLPSLSAVFSFHNYSSNYPPLYLSGLCHAAPPRAGHAMWCQPSEWVALSIQIRHRRYRYDPVALYKGWGKGRWEQFTLLVSPTSIY